MRNIEYCTPMLCVGVGDSGFCSREVYTTPHRYFSHLKISAATGYLTATDKSLKEIADILGFDNQFSFSAVFKKYMGIPPSEYRSIYFH